jgi:hypothetical protein
MYKNDVAVSSRIIITRAFPWNSVTTNRSSTVGGSNKTGPNRTDDRAHPSIRCRAIRQWECVEVRTRLQCGSCELALSARLTTSTGPRREIYTDLTLECPAYTNANHKSAENMKSEKAFSHPELAWVLLWAIDSL